MFKMILKMAYQNILLRKSRAILLILMIGMSMGVMVGLEGLYDGMSLRMIDKTKRSDSGELSLYAKKYRLERDIAYHVADADEKCKTIENMDGVNAVVYRLKAEGLAQTATKSKPGSMIGIDLEEEERFGDFKAFLQKGTLDLEKNDALIGSGLAKKLKVKIGSKVIFTTQDSHRDIQSVALRIKGIIRTSNIVLDDTVLYVLRSKVTSFLSLPEGSATQIALRSSEEETPAIKKKLNSTYADLEVFTFKELYPQMKQMQSMMDIFNGITFTIVMIVVFIGILGVMYVSILDRIREFGILLSVGYAYRYIRIQIIAESLFLGVAGYVLGSVLGLLILNYLKHYGLDLTMFAEGMESFGMDPVIYATSKSAYFISTFFAILLASLFSVWLPLRKIKKLNPVEVIRSIG